jgi:uncharacterized protein (TIGR00106 family)
MLVEFSIVPLGSGSSVSDRVTEVLKAVDASGLPYRMNPMGTVIEGEWEEVLKLIKKCHRIALRQETRVLTNIRIDDRKGATKRIEGKIHTVEKKMGKALRK